MPEEQFSTRLFIAEGSVEKHISAIFAKLGLPIEDSGNRRVLAVLRYLNSQPDRA